LLRVATAADVQQAFERILTKRARGKVVVKVTP
jgi:hypothetical protein